MVDDRNPRGRRMMLGCLGVFAGVIIALWVWLGPLVSAANKVGAFEQPEKREYTGTSMDNLKAIHTAIGLYEASEGQLPYAEGWMDAVWPRLKTADLTEEEAKKKLRSPSLWETNKQAYGYGFNELFSAKLTSEIESPDTTALVFSSSDLTWNAHGNPAQLVPDPPREDGNLALTASGSVVKMSDLLKK